MPDEPTTPATPAIPDTGPTEPDVAAPEPAATPEPAAASTEPEPPKEAEPAYKSDPRNSIYRRGREKLTLDKRQSDELFRERVDRRTADESGQPAPEPPAPETPPAAPLADAGQAVKISVYGEEREVPLPEVIKAGVATLQKDAAADRKISEVARREAALHNEEQRLLAVAANLRMGLDERGQPLGSPKPPATADAPAPDKDLSRSVVQALYSGDAEQATAALSDFIEKVNRRTDAGAPVNPEVLQSITDVVLGNVEKRRAAEQAANDVAEGNRIFREEFPALVADPDLMAMAKGLSGQLLAEPDWGHRSRAEIAREVGRRLATKLPGAGVTAQIEERRGAKRALPTTAASARTPVPQPQVFPSNKDYIERLRRNSGSNSAPR